MLLVIPGLHKETLMEAEQQLAMLCQLLEGVELDPCLLAPKVGTLVW